MNCNVKIGRGKKLRELEYEIRKQRETIERETRENLNQEMRRKIK